MLENGCTAMCSIAAFLGVWEEFTRKIRLFKGSLGHSTTQSKPFMHLKTCLKLLLKKIRRELSFLT